MRVTPVAMFGSTAARTTVSAAVGISVLLCFCGCTRGPAPNDREGESQVSTTTSPEVGQGAAASTPTSQLNSSDGATGRVTRSDTVLSAEAGKQLFARHCAGCHGPNGDGKGLAADFLFPKPRNLRAGRFRLVSTSNDVPTDEDLRAVLLRGMPGSAMPPWRHLPRAEQDALVAEVRRIRREGAHEQYVVMLKEQEGLSDEELKDQDVQEEIQEYVEDFSKPGDSTDVPEFTVSTAESIARGKVAYEKFVCVQCHGKEGKGESVQQMFDDEKLPTTARDFTLGIFKGNDDTASLYRRIAYGMPGTPMPRSTEMTPTQMMDLVHFIRSLSTDEQRRQVVLNREKILVRSVDRAVADPTDGRWTDVPSVTLRVTPLWWRNDAVSDLQVRAVHDAKSIAVQISWNDAKRDGQSAQSASFRDAAAMELYRGEAEPFLGMGDAKTPVDVWLWDADRQGDPTTVEAIYPRSVVDVYPFSETSVTTAELDRPGAHTGDQPDISLPARASGNLITPTSDPSGASSLAVGGPGSVTFRMPKSQLVQARGEWKDGRWTVVMTRSLAVGSPDQGVALASGDRLSVAFALWDGARHDRDGQKLITIWQDLEIE